MIPRNGVFPALLVLLAMAFCGSGCGPVVVAGARLSMPDTYAVKAEYEIGPRSIVVIPFRDERHTYCESSDGTDLATAVVGELISRKAATNVRSASNVQDLFPGQDLERVGWTQVGKKLGAQLVLVGDIQTFALRDPKTIGIQRGTCRFNYAVYDVEKNTIAYSCRGLEVYVPEYGAGVADGDVDSEKLRAALLSSTAMKVVQKFYDYKAKMGPPPRRY